MSGFSAEWLALREPADRAARDPGLAAAVSLLFADRPHLRVTDLGCGSGSNLRALAERLPPRQDWLLVDHDPALLEAAARDLAAWADRAEPRESGILLFRRGREIAVRFLRADLEAGLEEVLDLPADIVTAAALFDLVSADWLARLAGSLASRRLPLYTVLTYDGEHVFDPPYPLDEAILSAFHRHQRRDKGFGPAAGPEAAVVLAAALRARAFAVSTAPSAWRLDADQSALIGALVEGICHAAVEAGLPEADGLAWLAARRHCAAAQIGHVDLLAVPA